MDRKTRSRKLTDHAPKEVEPIDSGLGLERIVFFSDGVMAIAITLLVVDLMSVLQALLGNCCLVGIDFYCRHTARGASSSEKISSGTEIFPNPPDR